MNKEKQGTLRTLRKTRLKRTSHNLGIFDAKIGADDIRVTDDLLVPGNVAGLVGEGPNNPQKFSAEI